MGSEKTTKLNLLNCRKKIIYHFKFASKVDTRFFSKNHKYTFIRISNNIFRYTEVDIQTPDYSGSSNPRKIETAEVIVR